MDKIVKLIDNTISILGSPSNLKSVGFTNVMNYIHIISELNKMEIEQKEVYLLKEYGGLNYKEIAKTLEIEVNLVKSRLYNVRQKLIDKISKLV